MQLIIIHYEGGQKMDTRSKDILEQNLYRLKGVTGILYYLAVASECGPVKESPEVYMLLESLLREIYTNLEPLMDSALDE